MKKQVNSRNKTVYMTTKRAKRVLGLIIVSNLIPATIALNPRGNDTFMDAFLQIWLYQLGVIGILMFGLFIGWLFGAFED